MNWIDCKDKMPEEKKAVSDSGKYEYAISERVLAWDSMYGACVDFTVNGIWASATRGGYSGQVCHGIVAWMPIPEMDIEEYKL